ncbi:MAG: protein TolR [Xanthomonadales bacterium]|nr:protein TolR [Xanthomonadales bacterium]
MARLKRRRKPVSDINVVPYIDVMLVLLIIFMVTAPLLNLGVDVELPQASTEPLQRDEEPVVVSVDRSGNYFLSVGGEHEQVDADTLKQKVGAFVRNNPKLAVLVGGDRNVEYGKVFEVMALLQQAGAPKVGLMADPPPPGGAGG